MFILYLISLTILSIKYNTHFVPILYRFYDRALRVAPTTAVMPDLSGGLPDTCTAALYLYHVT